MSKTPNDEDDEYDTKYIPISIKLHKELLELKDNLEKILPFKVTFDILLNLYINNVDSDKLKKQLETLKIRK